MPPASFKFHDPGITQREMYSWKMISKDMQGNKLPEYRKNYTLFFMLDYTRYFSTKMSFPNRNLAPLK